ncbi:hypothetical protein [Mesomycoplasma flocculare]|uniref:hypothetical protein n=1 Tax=Mesomycoplasma flocculare TaxID=2128 RepID=UPI00215DA548|nr:hypothetical protein [Mesomycoplasma flocculare]
MENFKKITRMVRAVLLFNFSILVSSCSNVIISKSDLLKIESNVFNFSVSKGKQNLSRFTATLLKKTKEKLIFVTTHHSLNFVKLKINEQNFNIHLEQFSKINFEIQIKSKFKIEYENKEKDILLFSLNTSKLLPFLTTNFIDFGVLEDFTSSKNSLFSLGFVTLLKSNFFPYTSRLLFYTDDKIPELEEDNVLIQNIDYSQGSSGSPLFFRNKLVGLYRGKKIKSKKINPIFSIDRFRNQRENFVINFKK